MEVYSKEELLSKLQVADKKVLCNVIADFPIISKISYRFYTLQMNVIT